MPDKPVVARARRDFRAFDANGGAFVATFNFWGFVFGNLWLFAKGLTGRLFLNVMFLALPFGLWIWRLDVPLAAENILLVIRFSVILILIIQHLTIANRGNYYLYVREGHHVEARKRANWVAPPASSAGGVSDRPRGSNVPTNDRSTPLADSAAPREGSTSTPRTASNDRPTVKDDESPELVALAEEFRDGLITRAVYEAKRVRVLQERARPDIVQLAEDDDRQADEVPEAR